MQLWPRVSARIGGAVDRLVSATVGRPRTALAAALIVAGCAWTLSSRLELRADLRELLPSGSVSYRAYQRQADRLVSGATLFVVAESPDRGANRRFMESLAGSLDGSRQARRACRAACAGATACEASCGVDRIAYIEADHKETRSFLQRNRWLYAPRAEIERLDAEVGRRLAVESGLVVDLDEGAAGDAHAQTTGLAALTRELDAVEGQLQQAVDTRDPFPTGYFETPAGDAIGLRIVSSLPGVGDSGGEALLNEVAAAVRALEPARFHPSLAVGYGGDIPNALEERRSVASDAVGATAIATGLVLAAVWAYFGAPFALVVIALPVLIGVGCAYAFAVLAFGYVNTSGAFLGAIIVGNGINYPIVLLARYQDFLARGMPPDDARREAVRRAFRVELVGAAVAAIAYGSLAVTSFRGFRQFGAIGFVGMFCVWLSVVPVVPALLAWAERHGIRTVRAPRGERPLHALADVIAARWRWVLALGVGTALMLALPVARWVRDPWEYNFANLGSSASKSGGAGHWSARAEAVFGGKARAAGAAMVVDRPDQAEPVARAMRAQDEAAAGPPVLAGVVTVASLLPGSPQEQQEKLTLLARLRRRLSGARLNGLAPAERARIEALLPPTDLSPVTAADLPLELRRLFTEKNGTLGTVIYVQTRPELSLSDGHNLLRIAEATSRVRLASGEVVETASRAGVFAEIFTSLERDGPLASAVSFASVLVVLLLATHSRTGAAVVLASLSLGVLWMLGWAALTDTRLNFLSFVALPITFAIGCEYPFNLYDRAATSGGGAEAALGRAGAAVVLCSTTTVIGYGSLLFADNQALRGFGKLAMVGELGCVVSAFLFLPALLTWVHGRRSKQPTAHKEESCSSST